jgi:subtilisin family serine protease
MLVLGQTKRVHAAPNIFDHEASEMSRVFVEYQPGHKDEIANTLGIATTAGLINDVVSDAAVAAEVYYDFKKLHTFAVSVPTASLDLLRNDPNILHVEEDHRIFPIGIEESTTGSRSLRGLQSSSQTVPYGIEMVGARDVWDANRDGIVDSGAPTGANRKICIIDTGYLTTHEDLQGTNVTGYNGNLPWNQDGHGHGTHVAGTIAAMNNNLGVVGVTPGTV